jgi:hypothetical protein
MQRNDLSERKRVYWDGVEIEGLAAVGEIPLEKGEIDVPEFDRVRKIESGVITIPTVEMTYKLRRGGQAITFFRDWFRNSEEKDGVIVSVDAAGNEIDRTLLQGCQCSRFSIPEYTAESPTYAMRRLRFTPHDVIPIDAE